MQNFKSGLNQMKCDLGIFKKSYCTAEEEKDFDKMKKDGVPIPDEIYVDNSNHYYRCADTGMPQKEIDELMAYRQIDYLRTIKNRLNLITAAALVFLFLWIVSVTVR